MRAKDFEPWLDKLASVRQRLNVEMHAADVERGLHLVCRRAARDCRVGVEQVGSRPTLNLEQHVARAPRQRSERFARRLFVQLERLFQPGKDQRLLVLDCIYIFFHTYLLHCTSVTTITWIISIQPSLVSECLDHHNCCIYLTYTFYSIFDHNVCFAQHKPTNCIKLTTLILLLYLFLLFYIALIVLDTECYCFVLHILYLTLSAIILNCTDCNRH